MMMMMMMTETTITIVFKNYASRPVSNQDLIFF